MDDRRTALQAIRQLSAVAVCTATAVALLAGCATGQRAQTANERAVIDGVDAQAGSIAVSDVAIVAPPSGAAYAKGDAALLQMVLVNEGKAADALVAVTADAASKVTLLPDGVGTSLASGTAESSPAAGSSSSPGASTAESSPAAGGSSSPGASTAASPSPSDSPSGTVSAGASISSSATPASSPISIPIGTAIRVSFPGTGAAVRLEDLNGALFPSQAVTLTLTFQSGASIKFTTSVALAPNTGHPPTLAVTPSGEG